MFVLIKTLLPALLITVGGLTGTSAQTVSGTAPHSGNPILPGYFADPSLVQFGGKNYLYATIDPWGGETLGCWESADFKTWTYRILNWPTKTACKSPTSGGANVWAPSVVHAPNGRFYMYVSVRNEVWVGVAESPTGPWANALGDKPLVDQKFRPGYHMIDAEAFIDEDKQAYLYWGSGHGWKNGKCWAVKLKPDMITFDGEVMDVTPANYFEGPFMVKHGGRYFLTYSQGMTIADSYRVHYAVGNSPLGPFTEASNSPILVTDKSLNVVSPGHHAIFSKDGKNYILYHRHSIPFDKKFIGRQLCVDELNFTNDGLIEKIKPTHEGPPLVQRTKAAKSLTEKAVATASSEKDEFNKAACAIDDNYATHWFAAPDAKGAWLQLDLGKTTSISRQEIRPEYATKSYRFLVEYSKDGKQWDTAADYRKTSVTGSPLLIEKSISARYLRITFPTDIKGSDIALFEWNAY